MLSSLLNTSLLTSPVVCGVAIVASCVWCRCRSVMCVVSLP